MILDLFHKLPTMLGLDIYGLTECYLNIMLGIFAFFFLWIMIPILVRWAQLRFNLWMVRRLLKRADNLGEVASIARDRIFKRPSWATVPFFKFHLDWEEARLPGESKSATPVEFIEYLTPPMLLDGAVNRRLADAMPGIFVVLGIFGTFLGLVLGLGEIKLNELADLKQGLGHLIAGLSLAFYTSLVGIACSVIFSVAYRFMIRRLESALFLVNEALSQLFPYYPYEYYARRYMEIQADIKQGLQTLATDVATSMAGVMAPVLDEALVKNLVPVLQDLKIQTEQSLAELSRRQVSILEGFNNEIERMGNLITSHFEESQKRQSEAMEAVLDQYVKQMNETFRSQFLELGHIVEETTKAQAETRIQLVRFSEQLETQFKTQSELIEKTGRAAAVLNESLERLEGISKELKSSADDITTAAGHLQEAAAKAMEGHDVLRQSMDIQIKAMVATREELERAWAIITRDANATVGVIKEVIKELAHGVGDQLNNALNAFDGKIAEVVERFSGTMFEASQVIRELPQMMVQVQETISALQSQTTEQRALIAELTSTSKDLLSPSITKASDAFSGLAKISKEMQDSTAASQGRLEEVLTNMTASADQFDQRLGERLKQFKDWSEVFRSSLDNSFKALYEEEALPTAINRITEAIELLQKQPVGTDLTPLIVGIKDDLRSYLDQLNAAIKQLYSEQGDTNKQIITEFKVLSSRLEALPEQIKQDGIKPLNELAQASKELAQAVEEMKTWFSAPDEKRTIFKWVRGR